MKAVSFVGVGKLEMRDAPKPTIQQPTDVLLKVTTTATCGSDILTTGFHVALECVGATGALVLTP